MAGARFAKLLFSPLFLLGTTAFGQISQRTEIGGGLGVFNYTGDITRSYDLTTAKPAATLFYRTNISRVISFRTSLIGGQLSGSDRHDPIDAFAVQRNASFDLFLLELSGCFEYHFLDWRDDKRRLRFTPYLFGGVALFGFSGIPQNKTAEYSTVQLGIPFGGGMKYVLNPRYYISFEIGIRKTFFDYLDNISDGNPSFKTYQYGNPNDYDNYFFTGITLTYTFYDIPCATNPYR